MIFLKNPNRSADEVPAALPARRTCSRADVRRRLPKQLTLHRHQNRKCGARRPSSLRRLPGSACISINDEVIHGIPSHTRVLEEGDIVKIDVGAFIGGFHGDSANTFPVGHVSDAALRLIEVTKRSFELGVEAASKPGARIGDIGAAVDGYVVQNGYSTVKKYVGHGVGHDLHEDPNVRLRNAGAASVCATHDIAIRTMSTSERAPSRNCGRLTVKTATECSRRTTKYRWPDRGRPSSTKSEFPHPTMTERRNFSPKDDVIELKSRSECSNATFGKASERYVVNAHISGSSA